MISHSAKFEQFTSLLAREWTPTNENATATLKDIAHFIAEARSELITGALEDMQRRLHLAFQTQAAFMEKSDEDHTAWQNWSRAVEEASICFSGIYDVEHLRTSIANRLATFNATAAASSVYKLIVAVCNLKLPDQKEWNVDLMRDIERLRSAAAGHLNAKWNGEGKPTVMACFNDVCDFFVYMLANSRPDNVGEAMSPYKGLACSLAKVCPENVWAHYKALDTFHRFGIKDLLQKATVRGELEQLQQRVMTLQEQLGSISEADCPRRYHQMNSFCTEEKDLLDDITKEQHSADTKHLKDAINTLALIATGVPGTTDPTTSWLDRFTGKTFGDLQKTANETILQVGPQKTLSAKDSVCKAVENYKVSIAMAGKGVDNTFVTNADQVLRDAALAKAHGVLMTKLASDICLEDLRDSVALGVKEFRASTKLKEKDVFHKLVIQRTVLALQMKPPS
ncbi:unnamed protein product [Prorocentrum cordatum]|uniref:Cilia- and flagella-associated protein 206 n=1 Tax=Prorocentrum cordatum TaxID=2364126 RepID=A0ABN9Q3P6_9DINO|nr:unnamed protein product [Polarella glacialis]